MKTISLLFVLALLALTGCQSTPMSTAPNTHASWYQRHIPDYYFPLWEDLPNTPESYADGLSGPPLPGMELQPYYWLPAPSMFARRW